MKKSAFIIIAGLTLAASSPVFAKNANGEFKAQTQANQASRQEFRDQRQSQRQEKLARIEKRADSIKARIEKAQTKKRK